MSYLRLIFLSSGTFMPSSGLSGPPPDPPFFKGSLELSERKRNQLFAETKDVLRRVRRKCTTPVWFLPNSSLQAGIKNIAEFPSRLSLERFLVTFFEYFLDYLPFLHVPTWQAEMAHPCLFLSMLAVGAGCYKEYDTAHALHDAARSLMMTYVCHGKPVQDR